MSLIFLGGSDSVHEPSAQPIEGSQPPTIPVPLTPMKITTLGPLPWILTGTTPPPQTPKTSTTVTSNSGYTTEPTSPVKRPNGPPHGFVRQNAIVEERQLTKPESEPPASTPSPQHFGGGSEFTPSSGSPRLPTQETPTAPPASLSAGASGGSTPPASQASPSGSPVHSLRSTEPGTAGSSDPKPHGTSDQQQRAESFNPLLQGIPEAPEIQPLLSLSQQETLPVQGPPTLAGPQQTPQWMMQDATRARHLPPSQPESDR